MPSEIFEEALELEIGLLEAGPPTAESYPYPSLSPTGSVEKRTFRVVILENPFLRATFVPALGGRLLSLLDKRTQTELLSSGPLTPAIGGRRGVSLSAGIQLHLDGQERLTSLAAVQYAAEQPDDESPAGLWMAEAVTGSGLSWHLHVSMPDASAEIDIEVRVFNRTFERIAYSAGLLFPPYENSWSDGRSFFGASQGNGISIIPERGNWAAVELEGRVPATRISRFDHERALAPRQMDTWKLRIVPFSGMSNVGAVSADGAVWVGDDQIEIQSAKRLVDHKLVLLTDSGESLEAPVTVYPEKLLTMQIPGSVKAVAVLDPFKEVILRWDDSWKRIEPLTPADATRSHIVARPLGDLEDATFEIETRHIAHSLLGVQALADGDLIGADYRFEQSLLYNGEDHLNWWMKALAKRVGGDQSEEVAELLNAHYLAPLDPVLRAESFLGQGRMEKEPSALLKSMADFPENFIEVAALLIEARLFEQASRWIDEALRHVDLPMLRYLLAYAHLQATTMEFEVAKLILAADSAPLGPPYPWRKVEIEALTALSTRFPENERLRTLLNLTGLQRS